MVAAGLAQLVLAAAILTTTLQTVPRHVEEVLPQGAGRKEAARLRSGDS